MTNHEHRTDSAAGQTSALPERDERPFTGVAYARTARDDGQLSRDKVERQQQTNAAAATRLGIQVVAGFVDIGQPGTRTSRPGLNHLLAHVEDTPVDYIAVSSIDRLARGSEELTYLLMRLHALGVNVLMSDTDTVIELVLPSDMEVLRGDTSRGSHG